MTGYKACHLLPSPQCITNYKKYKFNEEYIKCLHTLTSCILARSILFIKINFLLKRHKKEKNKETQTRLCFFLSSEFVLVG